MKSDDDKKNRVEEEVLKTLESLDGLQEVEPGPHFYAGVEQRVNDSGESVENWFGRLIFGYRLGPALLALLILINVGTAYVTLGESETEGTDRDQYIEAMVDQYSLSASDLLSAVEEE